MPASARLPAVRDPGRDAARVVAAHPEQGWSLLSNGVVVFGDGGQILPDGQVIESRPGARLAAGAV